MENLRKPEMDIFEKPDIEILGRPGVKSEGRPDVDIYDQVRGGQDIEIVGGPSGLDTSFLNGIYSSDPPTRKQKKGRKSWSRSSTNRDDELEDDSPEMQEASLQIIGDPN